MTFFPRIFKQKSLNCQIMGLTTMGGFITILFQFKLKSLEKKLIAFENSFATMHQAPKLN